ncbi:unnamed protein product, partial [Didymodactylos carnosus]
VKYCRELAALYPDEIINFSCDNKAKVHVGTLAVMFAWDDSKYNPVERTLSYLSKQITSAVLNRKISNKTSEQNNFDNAVTVLCSYWDKNFYDSYQISCIPVISYSILLYGGNSDRINLLKTEKYRKNAQNKGIHGKFQFFMKHCRRSTYLVLFIKCDDPNCYHCLMRAWLSIFVFVAEENKTLPKG